MEFTEGSRGVYTPIKVLFDTIIYKRALQICWNQASYKSNIAVVLELLKLQQQNQIPSQISVEDMTDLLLEKSKDSLRVQLWEFELEDEDYEEARPLLSLVWDLNNDLKNRDIEFEAKRLLMSPESIPPRFLNNPVFINLAQELGRTLTEQLQVTPSPKLLSPQEVVKEVVPKVLQALWKPPKSTFLNMPSQKLSPMVIGVTKAVLKRVSTALSSDHQVTFSRSIRDSMVQSIEEKVRQMYPPEVLRKKLNCFEAKVLSSIADHAASEICFMFEDPGLEVDSSDEMDEFASMPSLEAIYPLAPSTPPSLTPNAEPAANFSLDEMVEFASMPSLEPIYSTLSDSCWCHYIGPRY